MTVQSIAGDAAFTSFLGAHSGQPLLINFVASWCVPCKTLKPVVDDLAAHYDDTLAACRVDIEECPEAARRFGVQGVPVTMLVLGGEERLRIVGTTSKTRLSLAIENVLMPAAGTAL